MSDPEKKEEKQPIYKMNGVSGYVYIPDNAEFSWIPSPQTCGSKESVQEFFRSFKKMPEDKGAVWKSRLDVEETRATCPIIFQEPELSTQFEELFAHRKKTTSQNKGNVEEVNRT